VPSLGVEGQLSIESDAVVVEAEKSASECVTHGLTTLWPSRDQLHQCRERPK